MMKIEIRADSVAIDGYVNAVERDSKVLHNAKGPFVEKIKAGAFKRALDRAKRTGYNVKVLLNHDYSRELTSTRDTKTKLYEDNIGLRCRCEIRDAEIVQKAREGKLSGWSFGFIKIRDEWNEVDQMAHRDVRELELKEVSLLDDRKVPAYTGTSVETREEDDIIEIRSIEDDVETVDNDPPEKANNYKYHNRILASGAGL
nr:MAG TPA: head maturation protease [Caudoviricetes sp.]